MLVHHFKSQDGFEQDYLVIQCTKSNLIQNWVNSFLFKKTTFKLSG